MHTLVIPGYYAGVLHLASAAAIAIDKEHFTGMGVLYAFDKDYAADFWKKRV